MQPIPSQRWGLGTIGASAFKPGWMNAETESRQMGIVGDFAVAIVTSDGDGDFAHASQLNRLAQLLAKRLEELRRFRSDPFGMDWSALQVWRVFFISARRIAERSALNAQRRLERLQRVGGPSMNPWLSPVLVN